MSKEELKRTGTPNAGFAVKREIRENRVLISWEFWRVIDGIQYAESYEFDEWKLIDRSGVAQELRACRRAFLNSARSSAYKRLKMQEGPKGHSTAKTGWRREWVAQGKWHVLHYYFWRVIDGKKYDVSFKFSEYAVFHASFSVVREVRLRHRQFRRIASLRAGARKAASLL